VVRVAGDMDTRRLSSTLSSFAKLGLMPGADTRAALEAALEAALVQKGPYMYPQCVADIMRSYETLG